MTYKVGGVEFTLQPTTGRWLPRGELGRNGYGHPVYPSVREFEIRWVLKSPAEINQVQTWFSSLGNTGTVVVDLPQFTASTYTFYSYTGCVLSEPELGTYFNENYQDVVMMVTNIRT